MHKRNSSIILSWAKNPEHNGKKCERKNRMNRYLAVNRIEFGITYLCNSKCRHCQLGEEEKREKFPSHIDKDISVEIVREVGKKYSPKSIMTFGGEPLLYPDIVYAIHKEAMEVGIPAREIITNGFWSRKTGKIQEIANNLVKSGVNDVVISVDCFHQEFIPLEIVKKAAVSLLQAGISNLEWNPAWLVSEDDDNRYNRKTKSILKELKNLPIECNNGNIVQPEGRATLWLKEFFPLKKKEPTGKCGDVPYTEVLDSVKGIYVEPDGRVAVCNEFYIGNAFETNIINLIENYDPFGIPEMKAILENGMEGLVDWAKTKGIEPDSEGYYSICRMCTDIRKRVSKTLR